MKKVIVRAPATDQLLLHIPDSFTDFEGTMFTNGVLQASAVTVTASGVAVALPTTAFSDRQKVVLVNNGQARVFIGGSTVTPSTGIPLEIGGMMELDVGELSIIYGVVATGDTDVDVRILEFT